MSQQSGPATHHGPPQSGRLPAVRPIYLGEVGRETFGMLHAPAGVPRGHAVLICPPFGNSDNGSYMPRRAWAQHLAARGQPTLRLDLPKSADSPGSPRDEDVCAAWVDGVATAAGWLRDTYGLRTAAIGLGLGGLVACLALEWGAPIDDLVLWAVPSRGRHLTRELLIFERMLATHVRAVGDEPHEASGNGAHVVAEPGDGSLESAGFVLSAETVATLKRVDLAQISVPQGPARRALLLDRDAMESDPRLRGALQEQGVAVETAPGPGFWRMMAAPYESEAPHAVIADVDVWLARGGERPSVPRPPRSPIEVHDEIELIHAGVRVRETPVVVPHETGDLLAIVTEPVEAAGDDRLVLALANAGTLRRFGPNRMWAEMARRWAARGVTSVRFDIARESDLSPELLGRWHPAHARPGDIEWDHYDIGFAQQYTAVLDCLAQRGDGSRFMVVGLSSGAYWSLRQALVDDRVVAAALVNPGRLRWDEQDRVVHDVRMLRSPTTWRRLMRGEIPTERIVHAGRLVAALWLRRAAGTASASDTDTVEAVIARVQSADQQLTILFSAGETLRGQLEDSDGMARLRAASMVTIELLNSPLQAHVLESVSLQREAHAVLDRAVERALVQAPRASSAGLPA